MADEFVSEDRWRAGADYVEALQKHGFDPDAALWARQEEAGEMVLALISPIVERVGSTAVYDTLFKAYDHAITPRAIDPWFVSLFGPGTIMARDFFKLFEGDYEGLVEPYRLKGDNRELTLGFAAGEYSFRKSWVYVAHNRKMERRRQDWMWRKFSDNIDRLAA